MEKGWECCKIVSGKVAETFPAMGPQNEYSHEAFAGIYPFDSFIHTKLMNQYRWDIVAEPNCRMKSSFGRELFAKL
jgi:hypothetical protein